jgi:hypothetical protein
MGVLFNSAELLYELGQLLCLDDIQDYDKWVYDLANGHLHHGMLGFLLQRFAFVLGMAFLALEASDAEAPPT